MWLRIVIGIAFTIRRDDESVDTRVMKTGKKLCSTLQNRYLGDFSLILTRGARPETKAPTIEVYTFTSGAFPRKYLHTADIKPFARFQRIGDEGLFILTVADIGYAMGPPHRRLPVG
jgi:hypothetical protein